MNDKGKKAYEIGYGKPPKASRFRKGQQSPNPKGRPKKEASITNAILKHLGERVDVKLSGGRTSKIRRDEIIAQKITNDALTGDPKSRQILLNLERQASASRATSNETQRSSMDEEASHKLTRRIVQMFKATKRSGIFDFDEDGAIAPTEVGAPIIELMEGLTYSTISTEEQYRAARQKILEALDREAQKQLSSKRGA